MTAERESQGLPETGKVYPNPGVKPLAFITLLLVGGAGIGLGVLLRIYAVEIVLVLWDVALRSVVNTFRAAGLGIALISAISIVVYFILFWGGFLVEEITLTKTRVVFKRKRNSIVIEKVTDLKEASSGRILRLTGLSPEGKTLRKRVSRADVGQRRWQQFKEGLRRIQSGD